MTLRMALRALDRNRVRSSLTMLGVIIGVAAVIAMVAIGQGATQSVQKQIASMGQNQLMILPGSSSSGAVMFGSGTTNTLTPADAAAILRECPSAAAAAVIERTRAQLVYQELNWAPATVQGCDPPYLTVREWPIAEGENFTEADLKMAAQVCLVGQTVVRNLFQGESPVGKRVRVRGLPFRIVGVLTEKGTNTFGTDQDDVLLMPWTTVKKKLESSGFNDIDQIYVTATSAGALDSLQEEIRSVLRASHRLDRSDAMDDFTIRNMTEVMSAMTATTGVMTALLAAIASVSLLVGGIGIMNIMLVSVTERTREIGLRMAIGARGRDVLAQFLVESIVLSGIGGVIGIALGGGGAIAVSYYARWPAIVSPQSIVIAVVFSGAVGVVFGFYPAWRASRLDPIDALRYE
ncbi:MAG: ABC transporter permease [Planctomycetota bacterium]